MSLFTRNAPIFITPFSSAQPRGFSLLPARFALVAVVLALVSCEGSGNKTPAPAPAPAPAPSSNLADPVFKPAANEAAVYYYRSDNTYDGWVLHMWNDDTCDAHAGADTVWPDGPSHQAVDPNYGAYWVLPLKEGYGSCANYIIHNGDDKDPNSNDQKLALGAAENPNRWAFAISGVGLFSEPTDPNATSAEPAGASAHWVMRDIIIWNTEDTAGLDDVRLNFSGSATLKTSADLSNNPAANQVKLTAVSGTPTGVKQLVPHLDLRPVFMLPAEATMRAKDLVRNQLILTAHDSTGAVTRATHVQAAKVLDDLYTTGSDDADEQTLGILYSSGNIIVSVWAPTATSVKLKLYEENAAKTALNTIDMSRNDDTGIWSYTGTQTDMNKRFYRFEMTVYHYASDAVETYEVTDPYSLSLAPNGTYSQFVNLNDITLMPEGWDGHASPALTNPEDIVIYEAHVRDFSIRDESVQPASIRGKYLAFTQTNSDGIAHLTKLREAGMNTFHILPTYDISTINEIEGDQINLDNTIAELCTKNADAGVCSDGTDKTSTVAQILQSYQALAASGNDEKAQTLVQSIRGLDGFNWGYDPEHYSAPEGSYATDPDGVLRILEKRQMIMALHTLGYRVAADVVYNHTSTAGVHENSILDRVVPGYYHRRDPVNGGVENASCCQDTATVHRMFYKLMVDSLLVWSRDYRFDAFRFDIMSYIPRADMLSAREELRKIDADTYFYGEGWNTGGSSSGNNLFVQATQTNLPGTQIGTFNDRWRDPVRDGALFNPVVNNGTIDVIRAGLAGTLRKYLHEDSTGAEVTGDGLTSRASYADDPADIINYFSKHDNETLWDRLQLNLDANITHPERVRIFHIASALPLMAQGVPFLQLGGDLMRSKSLDRNSYDSGDWFNLVDFTQTSNNWKVGLPLAQDNGDSWASMRTVNANANIAPVAADIARSAAVFREFLKIRTTSPLFRLTTGADVIARVGFHNTGPNQQPGIIVLSIDDGTYDDVAENLSDIDSALDAIVVVVNGSVAESATTIKTAAGFTLHDIQLASADDVVQTASFTAGTGEGTFTVPARTMAVFVKKQGESRGAGLKLAPDVIEPRYTTGLKVTSIADSSKSNLNYSRRSGIYSGTVVTTAGPFSLRFQTDDSTHNLGFADIEAASDSLALSAGTGGSIAFTAVRGVYDIILDASGETPVLKVKLNQEIFNCDAITLADSSEDYPFTMFPSTSNNQLFVRGNHSDWAPKAEFALKYKGQNRYQAVAAFPATGSAPANTTGQLSVQFKLASDDASWATQLFVQGAGGSIDTSPLDVGALRAVAFGDGKLDNNSVNLVAGKKYSFLLNLTPNANPSSGPSVGTLLIQACD